MEGQRAARAALALVPNPAPTPATITFCGHCGARPGLSDVSQAASRVCQSCSLGLLLEAAEETAPPAGGAFVVLDGALSVCAVSRAAERLLATSETDAVNRHITELLMPADAEGQGAPNLAAAVTWAARGDDSMRRVVVRPANTFGVRLTARISSCGPPRAALVVFEVPGS
jgi:hypothetical protein